MHPSNSVVQQAGPFLATVTLPDFQDHLVDVCRGFGTLWWGHVRPGIFQRKFNELRKESVHRLLTIDPDHCDDNYIGSLGNKLDMCHRDAGERWRWPIMITCRDQDLWWNNGENRMLSAGLRWPTPWQDFYVLVLICNDIDPCTVIADPVEVVSDQQLASLLEIDQHQGAQSTVQMTMSVNRYGLCLDIDSIGAVGGFKKLVPDTHQWVKKFVAWRDRYGRHPTLKVWADSVDHVSTHGNTWNIEYQGPRQDITNTNITSWFNQQHDDTHSLYVAPGQTVCADDFLLMMDLEHSVWTDTDQRACLMRRYFAWAPGTVPLSRIMP